ncbi:MAG TPA: FAD:protein FMN transferase, partial [Planctomycetota bacterium]|nr:FAD:protein FMN transferase [Planctomycetota bacterium]
QPVSRTLVLLLGVGAALILVGSVTAYLTGLLGEVARRGPQPASPTPPPRTRYDCLIIRNLTGRDDVVASTGFPAYASTAEAPLSGEPPVPAASHQAELLGTQVHVAVYGMHPDRAETAVNAALDRIDQLSRKLNIFDPESDLSRINREAHGPPVRIDRDLHRLVDMSGRVAALSDGAFDATVGPLTALWRTYRRRGEIPPPEEVERARARVDYRKVSVTDGPTLTFTVEGTSFDFGGIAKGFAAEEAGKVLAVHGVRSAVIDCGGDLKLIGSRPGGEPFRVGVDDPTPGTVSSFRFILSLTDTSVVTSGNYRQFTVIDGRRYSHIIDPRTGQSIEALPSVTVIGPDSGMCDALATAISVLGEEEGLKLIEKVNAAEDRRRRATRGI